MLLVHHFCLSPSFPFFARPHDLLVCLATPPLPPLFHQLADMMFGMRPGRQIPTDDPRAMSTLLGSAYMSTIKLRQAGFAECVDTADMTIDWMEQMQQIGVLPR